MRKGDSPIERRWKHLEKWKKEQIQLIVDFRSKFSQPAPSMKIWLEIQEHEKIAYALGMPEKEIIFFNRAVTQLANKHKSPEEIFATLVETDGKK